jgi:superfamily II DNA/RNA helicase
VIGRTARAETTGTAITFINEKDQRRFFSIESLIGKEIPKMKLPVELGEGPVYQPQAQRSKEFKKPFKNRRRGIKPFKRRKTETKKGKKKREKRNENIMISMIIKFHIIFSLIK